MNVFTFSGNLGGDIEVRYLQSGTAVGTFSVPVKKGYGEHEKTSWIKCQLWGKRAEGKLVEFLTKGQSVIISGEFSIDEWEKDGVTRQTAVVDVAQLTLGSKPVQGGGSQGYGGEENVPF